jgi:hypothetical protein
MIDAFDRFWNLFSPTWLQGISMVEWCLAGLGSLAIVLLRRPAARGASRRVWVVLAIIGPLACLEMGLSLRYDAMEATRSLVREVGGAEVVQGRRPWQAAMILVTLGICASASLILTLSFVRWTAPARLAASGLMTSLSGFALEIISLHHVDLHYGVYWSLWLGGLAMMLPAVAWASMSVFSSTLPTARRRDEATGSRTYKIPGVAIVEPDDPAEPIGVRLLRLALIGLLLALPEIAAWFSSLASRVDFQA